MTAIFYEPEKRFMDKDSQRKINQDVSIYFEFVLSYYYILFFDL